MFGHIFTAIVHLPIIVATLAHAPIAQCTPENSDTLSSLVAFLRYFAIVLTDGDYLNDWLTHVPCSVAPALEIVGHWLALLLQG